MNHAHQYKMFDPRRQRPLVIIGAGSVGSFATFFAAKAGVRDITVWDNDTVESHNIPMSLYRPQDLGRRKVEALAEIVEAMTGTSIKVVPERFAGQALKSCSVMSCVDEMDLGRHLIFQSIKGVLSVDLFVDTRMKAAYGEVYSIMPFSNDDCENYAGVSDFSDADTPPPLCGTHGVIYGAAGLANSAVASLCHFWQTRQYTWQRAFRYDTLLQVH